MIGKRSLDYSWTKSEVKMHWINIGGAWFQVEHIERVHTYARPNPMTLSSAGLPCFSVVWSMSSGAEYDFSGSEEECKNIIDKIIATGEIA
jgi:hypothetical protein